MKSYSVTIQMKTTEQHFPAVLFIMLYKVILTVESVDEILWCDHSNESHRAVFSRGAISFSVLELMQPAVFSIGRAMSSGVASRGFCRVSRFIALQVQCY